MRQLEKFGNNPFSAPIIRSSSQISQIEENQSSQITQYIASEKKRFQISNDEISRKRLQTLLECFHDLKKELPNVTIAIALGGSLSKGKELTEDNAQQTDIDAWVLFDEDELLSAHPNLMIINSKYASVQKHTTEPKQIVEAARKYIKQIFISAINHKLLELRLDQAKKALDGSFDDAVAISKHGPNSILETINKLEYYKTPEAQGKSWGNFVFSSAEALGHKIKAAELRIALFFLLDVGGGLKKHRQEFLLELAAHGLEFAEAKWQIVRNSILEFERKQHYKREIPSHIDNLYPKSFNEACKYYQVSISPK